jgi:ABC-type Mn2+/Zn2+ transport system ATPase subunit
VLLLDEPFTGLDRNASRQLGELLTKLSHEGRLVIASHHDLATAPKLFDEALLLKTRPVAFGVATEALAETNIDLAFGLVSDRDDRAAHQPAAASI